MTLWNSGSKQRLGNRRSSCGPAQQDRGLLRRAGRFVLDLSGYTDRPFSLRRTRRADTAEERAGSLHCRPTHSATSVRVCPRRSREMSSDRPRNGRRPIRPRTRVCTESSTGHHPDAASAAMTETSFALFRIAGPLAHISCCGSCVCQAGAIEVKRGGDDVACSPPLASPTCSAW